MNVEGFIDLFKALQGFSFALAAMLGAWAQLWVLFKIPELADNSGPAAQTRPGAVVLAQVAAIFLLYFSYTLQVGTETVFYSNPAAYGYNAGGNIGDSKVLEATLMFVRTTGMFAVLYGCWLLFKLGNPTPGVPVTGGKVATFILSGILAYRYDLLNEAIAFLGFDFLKALGHSV